MAITHYTPGEDAIAHHAANAAAVVFPVASVVLHLPEIVTVVVGILGIVWYAILIGEKIAGWRAQFLQIQASSRAVAERLKDEQTQKPPEHYLDK